ncbi:MAG: hypothetical protein ACKOW9_04780 [Candidatus Paceibacterota bacterium]
MKQKKKIATMIAMGFAAVLTLSACGGGSDEGNSNEGKEAVEQKVVVDKELQQQLNPKAGQAIVPNSIKSERVEVSSGCASALAPVRDFVEKNPSGLAVDPDTLNKYVQLAQDAKTTCSPQEWTDWYTKEFAGWLYTKGE